MFLIFAVLNKNEDKVNEFACIFLHQLYLSAYLSRGLTIYRSPIPHVSAWDIETTAGSSDRTEVGAGSCARARRAQVRLALDMKL